MIKENQHLSTWFSWTMVPLRIREVKGSRCFLQNTDMPADSPSKALTNGTAKAARQRVYIHSTKATLSFVPFSLLPNFLSTGVCTCCPHTLILLALYRSTQMSHSQSGLPQPFNLILNCCSPNPFSQWPHFLFFMVLTDIRNNVMCVRVHDLSFPTGI